LTKTNVNYTQQQPQHVNERSLFFANEVGPYPTNWPANCKKHKNQLRTLFNQVLLPKGTLVQSLSIELKVRIPLPATTTQLN
jgi:hypothetical protein